MDKEKCITLDTNILFFVRRLANESGGDELGECDWVSQWKERDPKLYRDLRALFFILYLTDQYDYIVNPNDATYRELRRMASRKSKECMEIYKDLMEHYRRDHGPSPPDSRAAIQLTLTGEDLLGFITDLHDVQQILTFCSKRESEVFVTMDYKHILANSGKLAQLGILVMSPSEWLDYFLKRENSVEFLEKTLRLRV